MSEHSHYISRTIELANHAMDKGNHPFGALLVHDDKVLLEAENTVISENDATRHAELNLVSHASHQLAPDVLKECTLYTSTEPCAMCAGAIYWAGIRRVVYGGSAEVLQQIAGPGIGISGQEVFSTCHQPVEIIGPVAEELSNEVHLRHWPHPS
ncbi:nucleoside deaminase [Endozoicomonas lisbonensis]|uniref:tRNA(Arg) A34 adenosine deaminase TadA n=1 Tax=Endozoicomonas lisbonensis TaxID=3120522 RepID=A0ABV2SK81_9GAMM